jgi:hypothetical protein
MGLCSRHLGVLGAGRISSCLDTCLPADHQEQQLQPSIHPFIHQEQQQQQLQPFGFCKIKGHIDCRLCFTSWDVPGGCALLPMVAVFYCRDDLLAKVREVVDQHPDIMKYETRHAKDEEYKADVMVGPGCLTQGGLHGASSSGSNAPALRHHMTYHHIDCMCLYLARQLEPAMGQSAVQLPFVEQPVPLPNYTPWAQSEVLTHQPAHAFTTITSSTYSNSSIYYCDIDNDKGAAAVRDCCAGSDS